MVPRLCRADTNTIKTEKSVRKKKSLVKKFCKDYIITVLIKKGIGKECSSPRKKFYN